MHKNNTFIRKYQAGGFGPAFNFLQQLSTQAGTSKFSMDGLINYKNPVKPYGTTSLTDAEKYAAEAKAARTGQQINGQIGAIGSTQLELFANKNSKENNPYAKGDILTRGALDVVSAMPGPIGWVGTGLSMINQIGAQNIKTDTNDISNNLINSSSGFTGLATANNLNQKQIGQFNNSGLLGQLLQKKGNKKGDLLNQQNSLLARAKTVKNMSLEGLKTKSNLASVDTLNQRNNLLESGFTGNSLQFGKKGLIFMEKNREASYDSHKQKMDLSKKIDDLYNLNKTLMSKIKDVKSMLESKRISFKEGGAVNLIVEGQLHARKHNLKETAQFKEAEITHKGVPVVTLEEGGDVKQQQEVEKDEIILHLELTKKMEELSKKGTPEAMIEAGKILSKEILKNTRDKNKLLKTVN